MKAMIGESMNWKTIGCLGRNKNIQTAVKFRVECECGVVFVRGGWKSIGNAKCSPFSGGMESPALI